LVIVVMIVTGLLVWHFTRASQARAAIRSRRNQIRGLWKEIRMFVARGLIVLIVFVIVMIVALKHLKF
jgi:ABC-type Fe3+ transport system permease subunit